MPTITAILGFLGVACGAFGAHALKVTLANSGHTTTWQTAVLYHLLHSVALLATLGASVQRPSLRRAQLCWTIGVVLFSGSLYFLALGGPRWFGPITPLGGLFLLAGWVFVFLAYRTPPAKP